MRQKNPACSFAISVVTETSPQTWFGARRRLANRLASVAAPLAVVMFSLGFSYRSWLRFGGANAPDPASGRVVYVKALKGVFYTTEPQALLADIATSVGWVTGAAAIAVLHYTRDGSVAIAAIQRSTFERLLDWVWIAGFLGLIVWGDHLFAVLLTGSLDLPPEPPPGLVVVPPGR